MSALKALLGGTLLLAAGSSPAAQADYVADVRFAIDAIEKECAVLLASKEIDWRAVTEPLLREAEAVHDSNQHYMLLTRLLARLRDGHSEVRPLPAAGEVHWPEADRTGVGMFWCRIDGKIYLKNVWNQAEGIGLKPGMRVVEVDGLPVDDWIERRMAELTDRLSFSSEQQARFFLYHQGLVDFPGFERRIVLEKGRGKPLERTLVYKRSNPTPWGPAFFPDGLKSVTDDGDVSYGHSEKGFGYLHLRRAPGDLPEQVDVALAGIGKVKGLIVDFRGNSGGGFDHDAFMGRFVPEGATFSSGREFASAGPNPYGGPVVAIIDATVRSAGETAAGLFKDDGRGYVIGESPTAGMSSSKTTIDLPSGLFQLYVSTHSNMGRYNDGRGLEGIGVVPHELVEFDPDDLEEGVDTLIVHAEKLLAKFPKKQVRYDPKEHGWKR